MIDLNKIKAAILTAFDEANKNVNRLKLTEAATKLLLSAQGIVNYHHKKMRGFSFDAFDDFPGNPKDLGWYYTQSLEKDFLIDQPNINATFNEALILFIEASNENIVLDANEAWGLFYRAYDYAGKISHGGSSYRYDFDKMIFELTSHRGANICMSIILILLVLDMEVQQTKCVEYYIRRLYKIVKDDDYYLILESSARILMGEDIDADTSETQRHALPQSNAIIFDKKPIDSPSTYIFTSNTEEEKWANIIKQFIADNNITTPLDGSMKNPTLAMIHHFYEKWQTQNRLLRTKIKAQDVLDFFIQKCGVKKKIQKSGEPVKDKTITNKIDGLKSKSNKLNDTPEITKNEVAIKKVWKTYTRTK